MKIRILTAIIILLISSTFYAKTNEKKDANHKDILKQEEKPNYLDQFNNQKKCEKLRNLNKEYIYFLGVIVENFAKDKKADLEKQKKNYTEALKFYFKNEYTKAAKLFSNVLKELRKMTKDFYILYKKRTNDILNKCAEQLANTELSVKKENKFLPRGKSRQFSSLNHLLKIAYFHIRAAEKFNYSRRNREAIAHLRLAKSYGINLLMKLANDEQAKTKVYSDYKLDLIDNKNQVFSPKK